MNDFVNGLFEFVGGMFLWLNVRRILIDKEVKGVSYLSVGFFASWGFWNLYFYPSVNAWWSFGAGCNVVVANTVWFILMLYYRRKENERKAR
jgi:hypothetical protein